MALPALVAAAVAFSFLVVFWISCTIYMLIKFYHIHLENNENYQTKSPCHLRFAAATYLIFYSLANVLVLILASLALSDVQSFWKPNIGFNVMIIFIVITACIGFFSFYLFAIFRLYFGFRDSTAEIKKSSVIPYIIMIAFISILLCFYAITYYLYEEELFDPYSMSWILAVAVTGIFINGITAISLVYQFISRLVPVVINHHRSSIICGRRQNSTQLDEHQFEMIDRITIYTLLCCISLVVFNVAIPLDICIYVWLLPHNIYTYLLTVFIALILHSIEMICIILQFKFMRKAYKSVCHLCDNWVNTCCTKHAKKKLKRLKQQSHSPTASTNGSIHLFPPRTSQDDVPKELQVNMPTNNSESAAGSKPITPHSVVEQQTQPTQPAEPEPKEAKTTASMGMELEEKESEHQIKISTKARDSLIVFIKSQMEKQEENKRVETDTDNDERIEKAKSEPLPQIDSIGELDGNAEELMDRVMSTPL